MRLVGQATRSVAKHYFWHEAAAPQNGVFFRLAFLAVGPKLLAAAIAVGGLDVGCSLERLRGCLGCCGSEKYCDYAAKARVRKREGGKRQGEPAAVAVVAHL